MKYIVVFLVLTISQLATANITRVFSGDDSVKISVHYDAGRGLSLLRGCHSKSGLKKILLERELILANLTGWEPQRVCRNMSPENLDLKMFNFKAMKFEGIRVEGMRSSNYYCEYTFFAECGRK